MGSGFTYMYCGLVAVFAVLFLNLLVARLFGHRRAATSLAQAPHAGGGGGARSAQLRLQEHPHVQRQQSRQGSLAEPGKVPVQRPIETIEAVYISNPDG